MGGEALRNWGEGEMLQVSSTPAPPGCWAAELAWMLAMGTPAEEMVYVAGNLASTWRSAVP